MLTQSDRSEEVRKHKARIREIERALASPRAVGEWPNWRKRLSEEQLRCEQTVNDLQRIDRPRLPTGQPSPRDPDVWQSFHERFKALAEEEVKLDPHNKGDRSLRGYVSDRGINGDCGSWMLSSGVNEGFQARFDVEATRAGVVLGPTHGTNPRDFWLHSVFSHLLKHKSKLLFAANKEGGIIRRVCDASAVYCSRLEKEALESEGFARSDIQSPSISATKGAGRIASARRPGRAPRLSSDFIHLAGRLWIEAMRQRGETRITLDQLSEIASQFDEKGCLPPAEYLEKKCSEEIRTYNSRHSTSKSGRPIKTWTQLVATADKDYLRGMRRLLSRCAEKSRNIRLKLSGN